MQIIPVLTRVPNVFKELNIKLPHIKFHQVIHPEQDEILHNSEIVISDLDLLEPHVNNLDKLRWLQSTFAGVDKIVKAIGNEPSFIVTRFVGPNVGRTLGEYVIANIINYERNLHEIHANQKEKLWSQEGKIYKYRIIADLTVGILGLGVVGSTIAKMLHFHGARVLGLARRRFLNDPLENDCLWKYFTKSDLPEFLKHCDYIINTLPQTPETAGLLSGNILENCSNKETVFINIGRSGIISTESLIEALKNKWLSAVITDVFNVEPLPKNSPLWAMPQMYITPHCAGITRATDFAEQFSNNLKLYRANKPLPNTIDFVKGY